MALSNWDTLAIDECGKPRTGEFVSPLGVHVLIYKNWLYVRDKTAWQDGGHYVEPTVMEIRQGDLVYKDVEIRAVRGPQQGVFAIIRCGYKHDKTMLLMAGCGVSGYGYPPAPCGHDANELGSMHTTGEDGEWHTYCEECNEEIPDAEWIGTTAESVAFLRKMLLDDIGDWLDEEERQNHEFMPMIKALETNNVIRYNQGDAYFASVGGEEIPGTAPGEADKPVLHELIEGMKNVAKTD